MANPNQCLASLARLSLSTASRPSIAPVRPLLATSIGVQTRCATNRASKAAQEKKKKDQAKAKSKARKVAAISCDPATFARDAKVLLDEGFDLVKITPVDQFRWSPHIEIVGAFER